MKISLLDQSLRYSGQSDSEAILQTIEMAKLSDKLRYHRLWVSEHHNNPVIAGASPAVLISRLAAETKNIRVGSGGIMLPNHSPLKVAEDFRLLEVMYPNRIDLGIGRAPGTDQVTAHFLNPNFFRNTQNFPGKLQELRAFLRDEAGTERGIIHARPVANTLPEEWLLSSGANAEYCAQLGMGLAIPAFITGKVQPETCEAYRKGFTPCDHRSEPNVMIAYLAACSQDPNEVKLIRKRLELRLLAMDLGQWSPKFTDAELLDYQFTADEQRRLDLRHKNRIMSGTPDEILTQAKALEKTHGMDELMLTVVSNSVEQKVAALKGIASVFGNAVAA